MLDYVERITAADTIEELWEIHCEAMAPYGFHRLLYGLTQSRSPNRLGDREDFLILTNLDKSYAEPFINDGMYLHAPMVRWTLENSGPCSWRWIRDNIDALTSKELQVVDFNTRHGIHAGYSISFKDVSARGIGAIGLIANTDASQDDADAIWAEHGREILAMNNVAHLKIMNLPHTSARKMLTKRQREALEWVGEGKTTQDIGIIMGLTPATVEKHLRLAREALDVETTAQAVVKASFQNQIFLVEAYPGALKFA
ncbi:MAG: LuxR family transcriptional regulator [Rhodobacter sp.]|nr:LuxR family transcriptional regulator [Rhodobacter sp.]